MTSEIETVATSREKLQEERDALDARCTAIVADRAKYAVERIAQIDAVLQGRKGGPSPIVRRPVKHPGNVCMYDHLQSLKVAYAKPTERAGIVDQDIARLTAAVADLDKELADAEAIRGN